MTQQQIMLPDVPPTEPVVSELEAREDPGQSDQPDQRFPVVAVGASAGGLEAFTDLLQHLPADTGMAFVFIQHLAPSHESMLAQLLSRETAMPVTQVEDGTVLSPNQVYVIPPNAAFLRDNAPTPFGVIRFIGVLSATDVAAAPGASPPRLFYSQVAVDWNAIRTAACTIDTKGALLRRSFAAP
jgi:hypothetical protein